MGATPLRSSAVSEVQSSTLRRIAALALAVAVAGTACSRSVAGVYRSERGLKMLQLNENETFRFDFGPAAADIAAGRIILDGRYELEENTIRLLHDGNVLDEGTIEGDRLVLNNGVFVRL